MRELADVLGKYQQGVATVGLASILAAHAKVHDYDALSWLTLILRAGMSNWSAEETIEAVDDIQARLHEGYRRLNGLPILVN